MALGYIDDSVFSNIANSIRTKTGTVNNYYPSEMADAINSIPTGGGANLGTKDIGVNGLYNANSYGFDGFSQVNVQVPMPTYNSAVLNVDVNGVYNAITAGYDGYSEVNVQVPSGGANLGPKTITTNGTYDPLLDGLDGYNSVTVQVPSGGSNLGTKDIIFNGLYNANDYGYDGFSQVNVQVPQTGSENINVFLDGMSLTQNDVTGLIGDKPDSVEARVYCNNIASINGTAYDNSVLEKDVTWEPVTNGFYNAEFNTYIYNNYLPMQRDGSLFAKFQGDATFNLAVKTSGTVTNMGYMMNACSNFNNSIQIGNNVTNCRSLVMDCTSFNQPVHFPNSVVNARSALWGCTNFNSPVTFDEGMHDLDLRGLFADTNFNLPFVIPDGTINVSTMFQNAVFNQPIVIPDSVNAPEGLAYFLFNATAFNQPITIGNNVTNCYMALDCPFANGQFNQDVEFPLNVFDYRYALYGQLNFEKNIYILNNQAQAEYFNFFLGGTDSSRRKNVYCNDISILNRSSLPTITGEAMAWSAMTNGYYNAQYNIYLYNNIFYETNASLYAKYQRKVTFDAVIRMSDTVTNCAQMLNMCMNFNSSVQIGNNVTDAGALLRNCVNFNQPITIPNGVVNCRTMLQGTAFNQPLVIPDTVTNCKWMLFNSVEFNQPLVIGNNVVDCQQMVEAYYYDDSTETDRYEGGTFNQPIIFPKSVATLTYALAGQQNMKSDIVLHNNACDYSWFLGNSHYEGNVYCPNGMWASKINNIFAQKNNTSGIASIYTPQSYADYNSVIRSYRPTGNSDTWIGDETNELVYSPTANIYIHCNWNGVLPEYLQS